MRSTIAAVLLIGCLSATATRAQSTSEQDHDSALKARGEHAMGFSQDKATHHFYLYADGGAIQISANSASDVETKNQIQMHLGHIAQMFADGDFEIPMLVHDEVPPGVPVMKQRKADIAYKFEKTDLGGRVRIATKNPEALHAVRDFLRYQITDHKTGDSMQVSTPQ